MGRGTGMQPSSPCPPNSLPAVVWEEEGLGEVGQGAGVGGGAAWGAVAAAVAVEGQVRGGRGMLGWMMGKSPWASAKTPSC